MKDLLNGYNVVTLREGGEKLTELLDQLAEAEQAVRDHMAEVSILGPSTPGRAPFGPDWELDPENIDWTPAFGHADTPLDIDGLATLADEMTSEADRVENYVNE